MKKIVVFILLTALTNLLYAQNKNCNNPLPTQQFTHKFNQVKAKTNETSKLQLAKQLVNSYCFSSAQIQEIATLFENDYDRLEFAKSAYNNVTDKENFYDVYDAFIYYSTVFRLHDYIHKSSNTQTEDPVVTEIDYPNYNYPSYRQYRGARNCTRYISTNQFNKIAGEIYSLKSEKEKYYKSIENIRNICLPTEYLMKIASLIKSEDLTLEFAKVAIKSSYDLDNYIEMKQVFATPRARSEFINFLSSGMNGDDNRDDHSNHGGSANCKVSDNDYQRIVTTIRNEKFNTQKVNTAKHLFQTNKCFSALQTKGIVELFDYENSRLEIAKYAYDFTMNKTTYYSTVSEALGFESSKKRLLDYINDKSR